MYSPSSPNAPSQASSASLSTRANLQTMKHLTLVQQAGLSQEMLSIAEERARNPIFNVRELTYFLDGGKDLTALKEKFMLDLERDPNWRMDDVPNLSLAQIRERTMAKVRIIRHFLATEPAEVFRKRMTVIALVDPGFWTRLGVHYGLFVGALDSLATQEQREYWVKRGALSLNGIIGCFGMTELGHGSNVAGLETTATYERSSDEFVIHTPTLTATKWWIGGAAHTTTHCAVYARLIVSGKDYGVKTFIVPLRDTNTYELLPGIRIGDLGKKMGRDGIDNGYIQFTHVRVPRGNMLMRHTQVLRDGSVVESPMQQFSYGALIQGRVAMIVDSSNTARKALTIALRYATVRRQGGLAGSLDQVSTLLPIAPKNDECTRQGCPMELKLLDYTVHQHRLLPLLAQSFAMHFAGLRIDKMFVELMSNMRAPSTSGLAQQRLFAALKEVHANSAGLKAVCTWATLNIIDQCRQSLGGHGYSEYSGLAPMLKDWAVQCSWEGDNTVLALQTGRYLIGCAQRAAAGKELSAPGVAYLARWIKPSAEAGKLEGGSESVTKRCTAENPASIEVYEEAFEAVAARVVSRAAVLFEKTRKAGHSTEIAYERTAAARLLAARVHCQGYLVHSFIAACRDVSQAGPAGAAILPILELLLHTFAVHTILELSGPFMEYEYFSAKQMRRLRRHLASVLLPQLRAQAIHVVDAFNLTDYVVGTPLGRYDGDVYRHYFSRIEKLNPAPQQHPYFERLIRPLLQADSAASNTHKTAPVPDKK